MRNNTNKKFFTVLTAVIVIGSAIVSFIKSNYMENIRREAVIEALDKSELRSTLATPVSTSIFPDTDET